MKIAIFTDIYAPWGNGGIASSIRAQKSELEKLGHEVTLFCPGFDAKEKGVVNVPSHKVLRISDSVVAKRPSEVEKFIIDNFPDFGDFDVVHVHYEASCSIAGVRLAQKFNLPLVQTQHGREDVAIAVNMPHPIKLLTATALDFAHSKCLPHTIKVKRDKYQAPTLTRAKMWSVVVNHAEHADVVITPSKHFAQKIEHYGVTRPIVVVSNGIPKELVDEKFPIRKMQDGDVLKMVWNCRVSKEKRIMPLLRALKMLKRPYVLHVYGNGNTLKRAERYAKKHNLKVKFYNEVPRPKIIKRMAEAHLSMTVSYNFDVQPMTLLEAEATGLPVFFCDPCMIEIMPQGSFVIAGGPEAEAMAMALESMPAERVEEMSKIMLANRKNVLQDVQIKKLLDVYKMAIELNKTKSM